MKTFDWGEYGMIEGMDSTQGDNFHDTHGDYVLLSDVKELEQQRDELLAALKSLYGVFDSWVDLTPEVLNAAANAIEKAEQ